MVLHSGFELLEGDREELAELGCGVDTGIEAAFMEYAEVLGATAILGICHGVKIRPVIIGCNTVQMVDTGFIERSYPREIDGMGDENVFVMAEDIFELKIPLLALGVCGVCTVLACGWCSIHDCFNSIRRDTQSDCTIIGDIEPIPVVGFMRHETEHNPVVHFGWINRIFHMHGSFVQRRCYSSNPMQRSQKKMTPAVSEAINQMEIK